MKNKYENCKIEYYPESNRYYPKCNNRYLEWNHFAECYCTTAIIIIAKWGKTKGEAKKMLDDYLSLMGYEKPEILNIE